jgi:hypothetical protein
VRGGSGVGTTCVAPAHRCRAVGRWASRGSVRPRCDAVPGRRRQGTGDRMRLVGLWWFDDERGHRADHRCAHDDPGGVPEQRPSARAGVLDEGHGVGCTAHDRVPGPHVPRPRRGDDPVLPARRRVAVRRVGRGAARRRMVGAEARVGSRSGRSTGRCSTAPGSTRCAAGSTMSCAPPTSRRPKPCSSRAASSTRTGSAGDDRATSPSRGAVQSSAALPGAFHPRRLRTAALGFEHPQVVPECCSPTAASTTTWRPSGR